MFKYITKLDKRFFTLKFKWDVKPLLNIEYKLYGWTRFLYLPYWYIRGMIAFMFVFIGQYQLIRDKAYIYVLYDKANELLLHLNYTVQWEYLRLGLYQRLSVSIHILYL